MQSPCDMFATYYSQHGEAQSHIGQTGKSYIYVISVRCDMNDMRRTHGAHRNREGMRRRDHHPVRGAGHWSLRVTSVANWEIEKTTYREGNNQSDRGEGLYFSGRRAEQVRAGTWG
jgi:hypothetical protein